MVGEPVTWTNASTAGHTVTSDDGTLDSGTIAPGEAYDHLFDKPGTYTYHCTLHPDEMTGTIVVEAAPVTASPTGSPLSSAAPASRSGGSGNGGLLGTLVVVMVGGIATYVVMASARRKGGRPR